MLCLFATLFVKADLIKAEPKTLEIERVAASVNDVRFVRGAYVEIYMSLAAT